VHHLVHVREGGHMGEMGMRGFQNAVYWAGATGAHRSPRLQPRFTSVREAL
jgi:hypothetical protein